MYGDMPLIYVILYTLGGLFSAGASILYFPRFSVTSRLSVLLCAVMSVYFADKSTVKDFFAEFIGRYIFFCLLLVFCGGLNAEDGIEYFLASNILPIIFYIFIFFDKRKKKR